MFQLSIETLRYERFTARTQIQPDTFGILVTSVSLLEVRKSDVCFSDILDLRQSTSTMNSKQYDVPVPILVFLVIAMSFHGVTSNSLYS